MNHIAIPRVFGILLLLLVIASPAHSEKINTPDFYYFNPDSLQSNLNQLKSRMDGFFARSGYPVNFQPFARFSDFDQKIKENHPAFIFLPHWYYEKYGSPLNLRPLLQPVRGNRKTYNKVLLVQKNLPVTPVTLKNRTLAMTSMGPDTESLLDRLLFKDLGLAATEQKIVIVPKDADALFALALGQVESALVVKQNMQPLAAMNEKIMHSIKTVVESRPIPLPLICYTEGTARRGQIEKLKKVFLKASAPNQPVQIMEMLQVDEWQAYEN